MCSFLILPIEIYKKININIINKKLKLRGPDNTNILIHNGYVYIHNLLHMCGEKVIQPIFNDNKDIIILFNGEIYNYEEFGDFKSDTECLLYLYKKEGEDFVKLLDGDYCFVIFDFNKNKLLMYSDIFATKPIFYLIQNNKIIISSLRSTICDIFNINEFKNRNLDFPQNKISHSNLKNINKNKPNEYLIYNLDTYEVLKTNKIHEFKLNQYKTDYKDWFKAFDNAIKKRTKNNSNSKIGICLSSGYDSGCICNSLNNNNINYETYTILAQENLKTIQKRIKINDKKNYIYNLKKEEYLKYKKNYQNNVEGSNIKIKKNYYNVIGDWAGVGLSYIFEKSRKNNCYLFLSGTGGDEIYSDYGWKGFNMKNNKNNESSPGTLLGLFPNNLEDVFPWENFYNGLMECFIAKEEYTGSLYGIEIRYPFLDKYVVQEFLNLKPELKNELYKAPLHKYMSEYSYPFDINKKIGFKAKHIT